MPSVFPHRLRPLLVAAVLAGVAGPALASTAAPAAPEIRSAEVSTHGLDLTTAAGVLALDRRLQTAVRRVCAPDDRRDLRAIAASRSCQATAWQEAQSRRDVMVAAVRARSPMVASSASRPGGS